MNKKVTSIVSYIYIVGWLVAYFAGDREGAKFYLNQSFPVCAGMVAVNILQAILPSFWLLSLIFYLADVALVVFWIIGFIHAIKQDDIPTPVVGGLFTIVK